MIRITFFLTLLFTMGNVFSYEITDLNKIKGHELEITSIHLKNRGYSVFPVEILACQNLVELNLADNGIINIPAGLMTLKYLKKLDFSGNQGLSYIDLDALLEKAEFQLETLDLSYCDLGFISHQIGRQKALKSLNVAGNGLNNLPYPVIQLTKLEKVNVSNNRIEDISWQVHQWWYLRELDVSGNLGLNVNELMVSLSVKDSLQKLTISHVRELPKSFQAVKVNDFVIKSSTLSQFPRVETSSAIQRLSFIDCNFIRAEGIVTTINNFVHPQYLCLNGMASQNLQEFLAVKVDSANLQNNNLKNIKALATHKKLKWIDVRGNAIDEESRTLFAENRKDVTLLLSEPVQEMRGIKPPIEKFVQTPTVKTVLADKENNIVLGRSVFTIPENSFVDAQGNIVNGPVDLSYTEYTSTTDILLSGITMTADSANENLMFSSGGMFNLTAKDKKGQELTLNPANTIQVNMMSSSNKTAMNLYQLDASGAWVNKGKDKVDEPFKLDMNRLDSLENVAFQTFLRKNVIVTENRYIPIVKKDADTRSFTITFDELVTEKDRKPVQEIATSYFVKQPHKAKSFIANQTYVYDGDIDSMDYYLKAINEIKNRSKRDYRKLRKGGWLFNTTNNYQWGINYVTGLNVELDANSDRMFLSFLYKDLVVKMPVVLRSNPKNPKARKKIFQQFFKQLNAAVKRDNSDKRRRNRQLISLVRLEEAEIIRMARKREIARQRLYYENRAYFNQIAGESSVSRSFELSGFGVWNCDQRARMADPVSMPIQFVEENGTRHDTVTDRKIYVVDYDKNGVVTFDKAKNAFYDRASGRTAILVFFTAATVGVYQSWVRLKSGRQISDSEVPMRTLDITNMTLENFIQEMEN